MHNREVGHDTPLRELWPRASAGSDTGSSFQFVPFQRSAIARAEHGTPE
jgi:hypothetical protein